MNGLIDLGESRTLCQLWVHVSVSGSSDCAARTSFPALVSYGKVGVVLPHIPWFVHTSRSNPLQLQRYLAELQKLVWL